jgi:hypothetical protein
MSDQTTAPEAAHADSETPAEGAAPPPEAPHADNGSGDTGKPDPELDALLKARLAGPGASPVMPWGTGPRPADWAGGDAAVDPEKAPPAAYHRGFFNAEHSVEVGGKWYPLSDDQSAQLSSFESRGVPVREACAQVGVELAPEAPAAA